MAIVHSPLRYPGGKQVLSRLIAHLIRLNSCAGGTYVEPYAGGASIALSLLFGEHVERVLINDADVCIHAFWKAALFDTEKFVKLLRDTPTTVEEWAEQRHIYLHPKRQGTLKLGFATFYLNRCNRSGIISRGGPIGGQQQDGEWKIDARFNREELERRIRRISMYRERIVLTNSDAIDLLGTQASSMLRQRPFVYLDPPYYAKGRELYLNYYQHDDHARLADYMKTQTAYPWVMSYDNVPEIAELYQDFRRVRFSLDYTARERREGTEIMILRPEVQFPKAWVRSIPRRFVTSADDAPPLPNA
jgi:DNA adenine methylase